MTLPFESGSYEKRTILPKVKSPGKKLLCIWPAKGLKLCYTLGNIYLQSFNNSHISVVKNTRKEFFVKIFPI